MSLRISIPGYVQETREGFILHVPSIDLHESLNKTDLGSISKLVIKRTQMLLNCEIEECLVVPYQPIFRNIPEDEIMRFTLEFKEWDKLITYVLDKEPLVDTTKPKKAKKNNHLHEATAEEIIDLGYPEL